MMACSKHSWTNRDNCAACRHNARMAQDRRFHNQQMDAINPPPPPAPSDTGLYFVLAIVAIPFLLLLGIVVGLIAGLLSLAAVLLQGLIAGFLVGGVAGAVTYLLNTRGRERTRPVLDAASHRNGTLKERGTSIYAALDPDYQVAAKVGGVAGSIAFLWAVLF